VSSVVPQALAGRSWSGSYMAARQLSFSARPAPHRSPPMTASVFQFRTILAVALLCAGTAAARAQDQPVRVAQFADWTAYLADSHGQRNCFALSRRQDSAGLAPRKDSLVMIANRPQEQVWDEIAITMDSDFSTAGATARVGAMTFPLFTQGYAAWVKGAAQEAGMVGAMRKAAAMSVVATLANGLQATDQFSLKGMPEAMDRALHDCGREGPPPRVPRAPEAQSRSAACQRFPNLC
jgi:hypothetical protein